MQAKLDSVIITLPHGGHFLSPPVCCRRHVGRLYPWITPASGVHSHPWFRAIASVSSHFYWKGLALVILRHWEEMKSPSFARVTLPFTLRTMICQDKRMGHEVALEFCPKMPCLLVILHPFYFTDWGCVYACACVTYLISRVRKRERNLAQTIIFHCVSLSSWLSSDWHQYEPTTSTSDQHLLALSWGFSSAWLNADRKKSCVNNIFH